MRVATALILAILASSSLARAEVYTWTDEEGVIHFTNVPPGATEPPEPVDEKKNTFTWTDGLGRTRTVHRVKITTYDETIQRAAEHYALPRALVKAIIAAESYFEPTAVSRAGALGLMQLMPKTAREMGVKNPFDPTANVFGGTRYLRLMANRFAGDVRLAVAAYNAGPERVEAAGAVPAIEETQGYVTRVLRFYAHYLETWPETQ